MDYNIRFVEERDARAVHDIFCAEPTLLGTMRLPIQSADAAAKRLSYDPLIHAMVALDDDTVVGFAELITNDAPRHKHCGELNMICVHPDWHGKGIADLLMQKVVDMADNWLNLHRMSLTVWTDNRRAIALYERHGFKSEGVMPDYVFRKGEYIDAMHMGRICPTN